MRLFDRIRADKTLIRRDDIQGIFSNDDAPIVIIADEIAHQIDSLPDDTPPTAQDFGSVAPPFNHFFIEAENKQTVKGETFILQRGAYVRDITKRVNKGEITTYEGGYIPDDTRCILSFAAFIYGSMNYDQLVLLPITYYFHLDSNGYILDNLKNIAMFTHDQISVKSMTINELTSYITNGAAFSLKALEAMHQKGEVIHYTPPRNVKRRFMRKYDLEPTEHYTLKIKPGRPRKISEIEVQKGTGTKKGLHVVRGHFREVENHPFIPDGTYFIKAHQRGTNTARAISKDYKIEVD